MKNDRDFELRKTILLLLNDLDVMTKKICETLKILKYRYFHRLNVSQKVDGFSFAVNKLIFEKNEVLEGKIRTIVVKNPLGSMEMVNVMNGVDLELFFKELTRLKSKFSCLEKDFFMYCEKEGITYSAVK